MIQYYIDTNKGRLSSGTVKQYESIHSKITKYLKNELLVPDYPLDNLKHPLHTKCAWFCQKKDPLAMTLKALVSVDPFIIIRYANLPKICR
jgi:hypothetical protein